MLFRKIHSAIKLIRGKRWAVILDRLPIYKKISSITNLLPHPSNYKYILIGGHGVGMVALKHYLEKINASPCEILSYEIVRPFIFYRHFDGLVLDKYPINNDINKIISTCTKKVPLYQIVRCPIEIIKSNVNVNILHSISNINNQNDANKLLFEIINNISHLMFYFKSTRNLVNCITKEVNYITMQDINDENMNNTINKFAKKFNYPFENINNGGGRKV